MQSNEMTRDEENPRACIQTLARGGMSRRKRCSGLVGRRDDLVRKTPSAK